MAKTKAVYLFKEGSSQMRPILGGKGCELAEMTRIGLPVSPGLIITTEQCLIYQKTKKISDELKTKVLKALKVVEKQAGKKFGDESKPLLVSVRSGAPVSMPGMMDTILNLGLNDKTVVGFAKLTNERTAYDSYRRLIQMFGEVVLGIKKEKFDRIFDSVKEQHHRKLDVELTVDELKEIISQFKHLVHQETGRDFPQDPYDQLFLAIEAVFNSWNNPRAITYRNLYNIPHDMGTAVVVQTMVFGNTGERSATGVAFTRNPSTGKKELYGEYLVNAQGEDVVAGIRTPKHISEMKKEMPEAYKELERIAALLEKHYRDMQDMEFTIENGKLWMLQTRSGKRTAAAAIKIAVDMVKEGLITKEEAIMRVQPSQIDQLLHRQIDPNVKVAPIAKGLPASPGAATGKIVFTADEAAEKGKKEKVILVAVETTPDDIHGMIASQGILTSRGGMTCVAGDSKILTEKGFYTAEELYGKIKNGEEFYILSYDTTNRKPVWRRIINSMKRNSKAIKISISQKGITNNNNIVITPDHKIFTFENRELIKKPLEEILKDKDSICVIDNFPKYSITRHEPKLAYLAGAIFTDGYISLKPTKGGVTFTQKEVDEKVEFIKTVSEYFASVFNCEFSIQRVKNTERVLEGRHFVGSATDFICTKREPARILNEIRENLVEWVMQLDEESTLSFLAGVIDGDGSLNEQRRIQIYIGKDYLLEAVVIACLKLGIFPYVTNNRTIYNVQLIENVDKLLMYTKRVKSEIRVSKYGSKLFSARQLFSDLVKEVDYGGKISSAAAKNKLVDIKKIVPKISNKLSEKHKLELERILDSNLRMLRVKELESYESIPVFNFEVEADNELDKNFIVFTSLYTPMLVSNCHAAVVARGLGLPSVVGCEAAKVDIDKKTLTINGEVFKEGDIITIDGSTGNVIKGEVKLVEPTIHGEFEEFLSWCDKVARMKVRANADTPSAAMGARKFGAVGIGLCRTERMFNDPSRLPIVQKMILSETADERKKWLDELKKFQVHDFYEIFKAMDGLPVTVRLLDPPLHEFLPSLEELISEITELSSKKVDERVIEEKQKLLKKVRELSEFNPMLGHRGSRLGITYPEIYQMQVSAIFEAACKLKKEGKNPIVEVMVPLIGNVNELKILKPIIKETADAIIQKENVKLHYTIGTMIEIPRAALTADEIAQEAEFFSFGTNDLTQTTLGFSRDDAEAKFLQLYLNKGIYKTNPFEVIDYGVGKLVDMAVKLGRSTRKDLKVGVCGETGGEPTSIEFYHKVGLDYVSCSQYRVPIARLACAHATLKEKAEVQNAKKAKEKPAKTKSTKAKKE
jgi:phosphoenolpyruvate synthase/pyruvate phosphate dikinase